MDFFFSNRSHALKFVDFVQSVVPANCRDDKQLVSHNEHTATYNYKYTFSVEIVPICRVCCTIGGHVIVYIDSFALAAGCDVKHAFCCCHHVANVHVKRGGCCVSSSCVSVQQK